MFFVFVGVGQPSRRGALTTSRQQFRSSISAALRSFSSAFQSNLRDLGSLQKAVVLIALMACLEPILLTVECDHG